MAEYTRGEIERMQREAVRRVQEMNERARRTVENTGFHGSPPRREQSRDEREHGGEDTEREQPHDDRDGHTVRTPERAPRGGSGGLLQSLNLGGLRSLTSHVNGDTALLISLGLLLMSDDADELLILAIIYIMM